MIVIVLTALALLGGAVWMVLNRPVSRHRTRSDRVSAGLLAASALVIAAGVVVVGMRGLL
jgi:uncharacterized membrane protein YsdA (DUF1294 family)